MRCVAPMTTIQPNWTLCYQLLLESISGFNLSLDPALLSLGIYLFLTDELFFNIQLIYFGFNVQTDQATGWPALQVQILQELTGTARRLGNVPLAIRHASLLVHLLLIQQHQGAAAVLSSQEQAEMAKQLEQLSQRSEMPLHPGPLALENGTIIPPVPLTLLPKILNFKLQPPGTVLAAQRLMPDDEVNNGPFLFTPIQFGSFRKQITRKNQVEMGMLYYVLFYFHSCLTEFFLLISDFQWVEGDQCEVLVQVINPSCYELRITNMQLLTEDVEFETEPTSITLPPAIDSKPVPTPIVLNGNNSLDLFYALCRVNVDFIQLVSGVPRSPGLLKIVGYSMAVLGLKNHCKLKSALPLMGSPFYSIRVIPALPRLTVQIASPNK